MEDHVEGDVAAPGARQNAKACRLESQRTWGIVSWPNDSMTSPDEPKRGHSNAPVPALPPARKAIRAVNQLLADLKLDRHPDKTSIGRLSAGFTFLGYAITAGGLAGFAPQTVQRFVTRANRLYEQSANRQSAKPPRSDAAGQASSTSAQSDCLGEYVRRWWTWAVSGLGGTVPARSCRRRCLLPRSFAQPGVRAIPEHAEHR